MRAFLSTEESWFRLPEHDRHAPKVESAMAAQADMEAFEIVSETEPVEDPVMNAGYYGIMDGAYHVDLSDLTPDERIALKQALRSFTLLDLES